MCRLLREKLFWRRYKRLEFLLATEWHERDQNATGPPAKWHQTHELLDHTLDPLDPSYIVVETHCFRLANGAIGRSGLLEPKNLVIDGVNYRGLDYGGNLRCELCERAGQRDMIPLEARFWNGDPNKGYRPQTPSLGRLKRFWLILNIWFNRFKDKREQNLVVRKTIPFGSRGAWSEDRRLRQ